MMLRSISHFMQVSTGLSLLLPLLLLFPFSSIAAEKEVLLGILAKRGGEHTLQKWQPTADYLSREIPGYYFSIIPLGFDVISPTVAAEEVDFILANSSFYVELEARYGVKRIATLRNRVGETISTEFGGVIFSRADRDDINVIQDLKKHSFMAVNENSLGGFRMAWGELQRHKIDPHKDLSVLKFGGTHDAVVYAVLKGEVDVGTVRSDTLERMAQEGQIDLTDFKLIAHHLINDKADFPFLHSTALYPEWPFASLISTPPGLAQIVAVALLGMPPESEAAIAAKSAGWGVPLNYQPVHDLLKRLRVGIYQDFGKITLMDVLRLYLYWFFLGVMSIIIMGAVTAYVARLNTRLKKSRLDLKEARDHLEVRVQQRTHELEQTNIELHDVLKEHQQTLQHLRQTSREKQLLLDSAGEGIYGIDSAGLVVFANAYTVNRLGWSESELVGSDIHQMTHHTRADGDTYPMSECPIHSTLQQRTVHHISDEIFWCKDGSSFPVEYTSTPIMEEGEQNGVVVVFRDVTERRKTEEVLRRTDKMDALGQLTGGIAHDFNNMLGVILGYSDLISRRVANDSKLELFSSQIHQAGERAKKLTSKLLAFSRQDTSSAESTDINSVILEGRHMLERTITARIELVLELTDDLWPVWIDMASLEDAILNMSINAMHAIPDSGSITLATKAVHLGEEDLQQMDIEAGDYVLLTVTDTGIGMDQATLSRIFDPFFSTKGEQGTGLGMSQVYGFVQQSEGAIHIDSELGQGTRIAIYFPRYHQMTHPAVIAENRVLGVLPSGHETILVVDDETALRELAEEVLTTHGYCVLSAESGEQALNILEDETVDLLFCDVIMPGMDGYQLVEKVQKKYPLIKIQMTSGFSDERYESKNEALHQQRLNKPFTAEALLQRIRLLLDGNAVDTELLEPVVWSDKISTGIDMVDGDHQILVMLINRCIEAIKIGEQHDLLSDILGELLDYISYHFQREEVIMVVCDYPKIERHKEEHRRLLAKVTQLIKSYGEGELSNQSLLKFIRDWFVNHITNDRQDRDLMPYCLGKERAIKDELQQAGLKDLPSYAE